MAATAWYRSTKFCVPLRSAMLGLLTRPTFISAARPAVGNDAALLVVDAALLVVGVEEVVGVAVVVGVVLVLCVVVVGGGV